jgi:hypothetical protein
MFKPQTLFREGKIIQPYLHMDRTKYVLFRVPKPPLDLVDFYQKKRKENKNSATNTRMNPNEQTMSGEPVRKIPRKNGNVIAMEEAMFGYASVLQSLIANGGTKQDIIEALHQAGMSKDKAKRWAGSKTLYNVFPKPE